MNPRVVGSQSINAELDFGLGAAGEDEVGWRLGRLVARLLAHEDLLWSSTTLLEPARRKSPALLGSPR